MAATKFNEPGLAEQAREIADIFYWDEEILQPSDFGPFLWLADLYCLENIMRRLAEFEVIHLALDALLPCKLSRSVVSYSTLLMKGM